MSDLNKTTGGVVNNYAIKPDQVSNVYDVLTGETAYGNIGLAKFSYLNSGGTHGAGGYGFQNAAGTMQVKNSGGSWTTINSGIISPGGNQYGVQVNDTFGHFANSNFIFNYTTNQLSVGDNTNYDTYISMSDANGRIMMSALGESSMGDYQGIVDGTYLSYDDSDDTVRVQCEEFILVGDSDWASFGNGCHFEVSDVNSQISCSAIGGVVVSTLSTGGSIDVAANANGVLQNAASDFTLKENIKPIENPLKKVLDLQGVNFQYKKENDRKKYIGLIAQEVMKIVPEVVFEHDDVFGINYKLLVPLLVEAVKERQKEIENLKERLDKFD